MSNKEYINRVSDLVLNTVGVGSFILVSSVKNYIAKKAKVRMNKIIVEHDLPFGSDELVELSIKDLTNKKIIVNTGCKIQRPSTTRDINHR